MARTPYLGSAACALAAVGAPAPVIRRDPRPLQDALGADEAGGQLDVEGGGAGLVGPHQLLRLPARTHLGSRRLQHTGCPTTLDTRKFG